LDDPQLDDPFGARLRADAAKLRRSPSPDFTTRVRGALVSSPIRGSGLRSHLFLSALAAAVLLLTLGFGTWSNSGAQGLTTGMQASTGPRVVQVADPRGWGALLCDSYSEGVQARLESEFDGVMGDMGRLARGLVSQLPSGLLGRVGFEQ